MSTYNTIHLKGSGRYEEGFANAALTPGHLIETMSTGKVRKAATRGAVVAPAFAIESPLQPSATGDRGRNIDSPYAADDLVSYVHAARGDEIYAFISSGENIVKGDKLVSTGDGTLEKATGTFAIIAEARENLNLSATASVDTRCPVRIL